MYPTTAIGRILTCLCALVGSATMGMLVSVLVDRYQRVYNRKMYVPESSKPPVDIDNIDEMDEDSDSVFSTQKRRLSAALSQPLSSLQARRKHGTPSVAVQPHTLQFLVSFDDRDQQRTVTNKLVTALKEKLTEALSDAEIEINLKLMDNDNQELWTLSSLDSTTNTKKAASLSNLHAF